MGRSNYGEQSERRAIARQLKQEGKTYAEVGKAMGISRQRAQQLVAPLRRVANEMIELAGGKCQRCGQEGKLDLHHSDYNSKPSQVLCVSCHRSAHAKDKPMTKAVARIPKPISAKRPARNRSNAFYIHRLKPATRKVLQHMADNDHAPAISLSAQIEYILDNAAAMRAAQPVTQ